MKLDKDPLYDLDDNLLGHSYTASFNFNEAVDVLRCGRTTELRNRAGIDANSRGVTWDKSIQKREYYLEWFQPVRQVENFISPYTVII